MRAARGWVWLWALALGSMCSSAAACEPGKTHVLGRVPLDARPDAVPANDASTPEADAEVPEQDAAPTSDAELPYCESNDDCDPRERPVCSEELGHCVECIRDRHCDEDEYCRDSTGVCVERR